MNNLPNELWLFIFEYIHPIDILYSFNNLNQRFQQLIIEYKTNIDLNDVPYKYYKLFCEEILPYQGHSIYSLTLKGDTQLKLFNKNIFRLPNIKYLTLIPQATSEYRGSIFNTEGNYYLQQLKHFKYLTDLHVHGCFNLSYILKIISHNHPLYLTNLTLLRTGKDYEDKNFSMDYLPMPSIKVLTIHLKSLSDIFQLLQIMVNVKEINLSVSNVDDIPKLNQQVTRSENKSLKKQIEVNNDSSNQGYSIIKSIRRRLITFKTSAVNVLSTKSFFGGTSKKALLIKDMDRIDEFIGNFSETIPKSSIKLQLQHVQSYRKINSSYTKNIFKSVKSFLDQFKDFLQSFTLIINTNEKEFVDFESLQSLQNILTSLVKFQYLIHTNHQPSSDFVHVEKFSDETYNIYTMNPTRPVPFNDLLWSNEFFLADSELTQDQLRQTGRLWVSLNQNDMYLPSFLLTDNIKWKFLNLREIHISFQILSYSSCNEIMLNMKKSLSILISLSPHLNELILMSFGYRDPMMSSQLMIELFKDIFIKKSSRNKITRLSCTMLHHEKLHQTYLHELAEIFPNLNNLCLTDFRFTKDNDGEYLSSKSIIVQTQKFFRNITHLYLNMDLSYVDSKYIKDYKRWLREQNNHFFYTDYAFRKNSLSLELSL